MSSSSPSSSSSCIHVHIVGTAYVDLFCFLQGGLPQKGGDALLAEPVTTLAGGSSTNTATHLESLINNDDGNNSNNNNNNQKNKNNMNVVLHIALNENDNQGQVLLQHVQEHKLQLVNHRDPNDPAGTPHCVAIVSEGDRSFLSFNGCMENFSAEHLNWTEMAQHNGPVHIHLAGYFCTPGFQSGKLVEPLSYFINLRKTTTTRQKIHKTIISMVSQADANLTWDSGIFDVIPLLDCFIMNEDEANNIQQSKEGKSSSSSKAATSEKDLMKFYSSFNTKACFVITKGAQGAIAFRNGKLIASVGPVVPVTVVDPTGAGDGFAAGFLHGIWKHHQDEKEEEEDENEHDDVAWPTTNAVEQGLLWGCAVGTSVVQIRGASIPAKQEDVRNIYQQMCQKL